MKFPAGFPGGIYVSVLEPFYRRSRKKPRLWPKSGKPGYKFLLEFPQGMCYNFPYGNPHLTVSVVIVFLELSFLQPLLFE
jgi:hypothetical protein